MNVVLTPPFDFFGGMVAWHRFSVSCESGALRARVLACSSQPREARPEPSEPIPGTPRSSSACGSRGRQPARLFACGLFRLDGPLARRRGSHRDQGPRGCGGAQCAAGVEGAMRPRGEYVIALSPQDVAIQSAPRCSCRMLGHRGVAGSRRRRPGRCWS